MQAGTLIGVPGLSVSFIDREYEVLVSGLRWVQMLLLLVLVQPLVLWAMPCHTGAEQSDVEVEHHSTHHAIDADQQVATDLATPSSNPFNHTNSFHPSCCDEGSLCLMSGCAATVFGQAAVEWGFLPPSVVFQHYVSIVPDVPVSLLYRPPIFL